MHYNNYYTVLTMFVSSQCRYRVPSDSISCSNQSCSTVHSGGFTSQLSFDVSLSIADHTGSIDYVRITGEPANELLETTVSNTAA